MFAISYACQYCGMTAPNQQLLMQHIVIFHMPMPSNPLSNVNDQYHGIRNVFPINLEPQRIPVFSQDLSTTPSNLLISPSRLSFQSTPASLGPNEPNLFQLPNNPINPPNNIERNESQVNHDTNIKIVHSVVKIIRAEEASQQQTQQQAAPSATTQPIPKAPTLSQHHSNETEISQQNRIERSDSSVIDPVVQRGVMALDHCGDNSDNSRNHQKRDREYSRQNRETYSQNENQAYLENKRSRNEDSNGRKSGPQTDQRNEREQKNHGWGTDNASNTAFVSQRNEDSDWRKERNPDSWMGSQKNDRNKNIYSQGYRKHEQTNSRSGSNQVETKDKKRKRQQKQLNFLKKIFQTFGSLLFKNHGSK